GLLLAQDPAPAPAKKGKADAQAQSDVDPLKRPMSEKQRKESEKSFKQELSREFKKWLDEEVRWIISDEERDAFKKLSNDEERDKFIDQFWLRREPSPDTVENDYKAEHYRRKPYANERYHAGIPQQHMARSRMA